MIIKDNIFLELLMKRNKKNYVKPKLLKMMQVFKISYNWVDTTWFNPDTKNMFIHLYTKEYILIQAWCFFEIRGNSPVKKINILCKTIENNIDGLVQDCSNSSALAMELLQSCTKPSTYNSNFSNIIWNAICNLKTIFNQCIIPLLWN